jgi:hypothetical protein
MGRQVDSVLPLLVDLPSANSSLSEFRNTFAEKFLDFEMG